MNAMVMGYTVNRLVIMTELVFEHNPRLKLKDLVLGITCNGE